MATKTQKTNNFRHILHHPILPAIIYSALGFGTIIAALLYCRITINQQLKEDEKLNDQQLNITIKKVRNTPIGSEQHNIAYKEYEQARKTAYRKHKQLIK